MSQQTCQQCNHLFESGDEVKATIIADYVSLKSSIIYALSKPKDCLEIVHHNCQTPKGAPEGD